MMLLSIWIESFLYGWSWFLSSDSDSSLEFIKLSIIWSPPSILWSLSMSIILVKIWLQLFLRLKMFRPGILLSLLALTLGFLWLVWTYSVVSSLCFQAFLRKSNLFFVYKSSNSGLCNSFILSRLLKFNCKVSHSQQDWIVNYRFNKCLFFKKSFA